MEHPGPARPFASGGPITIYQIFCTSLVMIVHPSKEKERAAIPSANKAKFFQILPKLPSPCSHPLVLCPKFVCFTM